MEILAVAVINIAFTLFVYISFSRRLQKMSAARLPEELQEEIGKLVTSFNRTANTNIDLLDDRISALEPLSGKAAQQIERLEGMLKRAEALHRQREEQIKSTLENIQPVQVPAADRAGAAAYSRVEKKAQKPAAKAKTGTRASARKRKTNDEKIMEMLEKGLQVEEIAAKIKLPVEAVRLKIRLLSVQPGSE